MTTRVARDDTGKAPSAPGLVRGDRAPHPVLASAIDLFHFAGVLPRLHSRRAPESYSSARLAPEDNGP